MAITVKRAEGFVDFCADLSLRADWESAVEALDKARKTPSGQMIDTAVSDAAALVHQLEAQMDESKHIFRLHGLKRSLWQSLAGEHEPREDNRNDATLGVNTSTFFDAVALESIVGVTLKTKDGEVVDFDPATEWITLADDMTDGQYNEFVEKFLELNRGVTGVPFSRAASLVTRSSEASSSKPSS